MHHPLRIAMHRSRLLLRATCTIYVFPKCRFHSIFFWCHLVWTQLLQFSPVAACVLYCKSLILGISVWYTFDRQISLPDLEEKRFRFGWWFTGRAQLGPAVTGQERKVNNFYTVFTQISVHSNDFVVSDYSSCSLFPPKTWLFHRMTV